MAEIFKEFDIFSKIDENLRKKIKIFNLFYLEQCLLFITDEDIVYELSKYGHHLISSSKLHVIPELCHKSIKQFFVGYNFVLALNSEGQVFS